MSIPPPAIPVAQPGWISVFLARATPQGWRIDDVGPHYRSLLSAHEQLDWDCAVCAFTTAFAGWLDAVFCAPSAAEIGLAVEVVASLTGEENTATVAPYAHLNEFGLDVVSSFPTFSEDDADVSIPLERLCLVLTRLRGVAAAFGPAATGQDGGSEWATAGPHPGGSLEAFQVPAADRETACLRVLCQAVLRDVALGRPLPPTPPRVSTPRRLAGPGLTKPPAAPPAGGAPTAMGRAVARAAAALARAAVDGDRLCVAQPDRPDPPNRPTGEGQDLAPWG